MIDDVPPPKIASRTHLVRSGVPEPVAVDVILARRETRDSAQVPGIDRERARACSVGGTRKTLGHAAIPRRDHIPPERRQRQLRGRARERQSGMRVTTVPSPRRTCALVHTRERHEPAVRRQRRRDRRADRRRRLVRRAHVRRDPTGRAQDAQQCCAPGTRTRARHLVTRDSEDAQRAQYRRPDDRPVGRPTRARAPRRPSSADAGAVQARNASGIAAIGGAGARPRRSARYAAHARRAFDLRRDEQDRRTGDARIAAAAR